MKFKTKLMHRVSLQREAKHQWNSCLTCTTIFYSKQDLDIVFHQHHMTIRALKIQMFKKAKLIVQTLPSNLEYSLKGLLSCWGHCSRRRERVDLVPVLLGLSLKSFFSKRKLKSSAKEIKANIFDRKCKV